MNNEIPQGWHIREVNDFSEVISGSTPDTSNPRYWNGEIIWITPEDLSLNSKVYMNDSNKKISKLGLKNSSAKIIPKNSIVMSSRAPIGYLAVVTSEYTTNQGCKSLHLLDSSVPEFIYYSLLWNMNQIKQRGEGTTFSEISKKDLEKISVLMPRHSSEQKKIALILQNVDNSINKTVEVIEKYKKMKQGLLQDLFVWDCGDSRREKWGCENLNKYLQYISYGFTNPMPDTDEGPYMITALNIFDGKIHYETCRHTSAKLFAKELTNKSKPKIDDILLTKDGSLGRLALVEKRDICINQSVAVLRANRRVIPEFLKKLLEAPVYQKRMLDDAGGSTIKHIYISKVDKMEICVPDDKREQNRIIDVLNSMESKIDSEQSYLDKLIKIKSGLMQDLLSGKVRVGD